jgi:glycosyltransferase involved in cell wall biosynthesis
LGVASRVHFAGRTDDPYAFYRAADFFVLPTRHDPCSLVVLESLVMGVPVISTVFNGACEIMTNGIHGFVLENPSEVAPLARAMDEMADDARRRGMSEACLALRTPLSFDVHLNRLEAIYQAARAH